MMDFQMQEIFVALQETLQSIHQNGIHSLGPFSYVLLAILVATEGPLTTLVGAAGAAAGLLDIRWFFIAAVIVRFFINQVQDHRDRSDGQ